MDVSFPTPRTGRDTLKCAGHQDDAQGHVSITKPVHDTATKPSMLASPRLTPSMEPEIDVELPPRSAHTLTELENHEFNSLEPRHVKDDHGPGISETMGTTLLPSLTDLTTPTDVDLATHTFEPHTTDHSCGLSVPFAFTIESDMLSGPLSASRDADQTHSGQLIMATQTQALGLSHGRLRTGSVAFHRPINEYPCGSITHRTCRRMLQMISVLRLFAISLSSSSTKLHFLSQTMQQ